jgi:hypothetical protein
MRRFVVPLVAFGWLLAGAAPQAYAFPVTASGGGVPFGTCSFAGISVTVSNNLGTGNFNRFRVTTADGTLLSSDSLVPQPAWDNFGPGSSTASIAIAPQPVGTVIGIYYSIGDSPSTAPNTGEWFGTYTCAAAQADSVVLSTCFGQLGTCPQSVPIPGPTPDPGETPAQAPAAETTVAAPTFTG